MTTFYRLDGGRLTYAEYWRLCPEPVSFLVASFLKLVGRPFRFTFAIPRPDELRVVPFEQLPASARHAFGPRVLAAVGAGARLVFCYRLEVPEPHRLAAAACLLDPTGEAYLSIIFCQENDTRNCQMTCASRLADGTVGVTTTMRKTFRPVPGAHIERCRRADAPTLLARHRDHLDRLANQGLFPERLSAAKLPGFVLENEQRYVDFHISRGVFVPIAEEELDQIRGPQE